MCLSYDYLHATPDIITARSLRPTYQSRTSRNRQLLDLDTNSLSRCDRCYFILIPISARPPPTSGGANSSSPLCPTRCAALLSRHLPPVVVMFGPPPPPLDLACGTRPSKTLPLSRLLFLVSVNRLGVSRSFGSLSCRHVCPVQSRWVCSWTCLDLLFLIRFFVPDLYAQFS